MHLALVGTPNSGKTSLFNALTGSRQKVANYPGVTVERKAGLFVTPHGPPGVAGRPARHLFAARPQPRRGNHPRRRARPHRRRGAARSRAVRRRRHQSAADAPPRARTEAHRPADDAGAQHVRHRARRGIDIDLPKLVRELGVPVVTSIAVRKGGTEELLRRTDEIIAAQAPRPAAGKSLAAADGRAIARRPARGRPHHRRDLSLPTRPDTWTARVDAVVLHPVAGLAILALILFVMFQAVFAWAQPLMELLSSTLRRARAVWCTTPCPRACCKASCRTA